jgi:hypothetical protein
MLTLVLTNRQAEWSWVRIEPIFYRVQYKSERLFKQGSEFIANKNFFQDRKIYFSFKYGKNKES